MALEHLELAGVFRFFEALCAIPHGSGNTRAISDYCVRFAEERGLEHYQDALNNVIIIAPAAPGYEAAPPLILQGHLDMVCARAPGCEKDMSREGLSLFVDGDSIGASGTTLGGDDGIAVAMALAVLDDPTLPRPRIEAVFTVEEETGMDGANGLDVSPLRGRTMLNIDSEEEGVFTVACAGGAKVSLGWQLRRETWNAVPLRLRVEGLAGGHSGMEIDKGRANANILMGRWLRALSLRTELRLCTLAGGTADNAIPFSCEAEAAVSPAAADAVLSVTEALSESLQKEFSGAEPGLRLCAEMVSVQTLEAVCINDTRRIISALTLSPNGVQAMSRVSPGLPETSLNLGILSLRETEAAMTFSVRSSVPSRKAKVVDRLRCIAEVTGGTARVGGEYPAWEYLASSPLRERMLEVYRAQYGAEPQVLSIHAGLECGILAEKLPGLDCVSFGPDITDIHTAGERLHISSVRRVWAFLLEVLRRSR